MVWLEIGHSENGPWKSTKPEQGMNLSSCGQEPAGSRELYGQCSKHPGSPEEL